MTGTIDDFIGRWHRVGGTELANYQLFLTELAELLELPTPNPQTDDSRDNEYVFEHRLTFLHGDGSESRGRIDLYRRGCFICEAKATGLDEAQRSFDVAMQRARQQAENYARALPAEDGRPPFLIVVDVGVAIELYSEFTRSGATYVPFPDPRTHRIHLDDLRDETVRERLKAVWLDPLSLDPARRAARVTRDIAGRLAQLAKSLEKDHEPELVASFLMRCLFTMFSEDVGLLPKACFTDLLDEMSPEQFVPLTEALWQNMNDGGFSTVLRHDLLKFNGGLFSDSQALPLDRDQIALVKDAADADWREVEPAIFGTLLERALNKAERHKLGAHYTPRAYVERLVMPTVIEPLRNDWQAVQAAALQLEKDGSRNQARKAIEAFHHHLCEVKVLDPACGSANFLYVTLEHFKRLEGEVLNTLKEMQGGQQRMEAEGYTVSPKQFLGLEVNPRAAAIAEMVLWIGYLQWHFRTFGNVAPPQPVLQDCHNIECRDAVLAWDSIESETDEHGNVITRWDGKTVKTHPTTGKDVPDESAQEPVVRYVVPQKARWPEADFVVGNPPFIGNFKMRQTLGDGYAEALRGTYPRVPESADYVMYWWHHAADYMRSNRCRRFGFITTNSLKQAFNRRVVEHHMEAKEPLSLVFAIPDHPWVDNADGAAVRIAMTVAEMGVQSGDLLRVTSETRTTEAEREVEFESRHGIIHSNLRTGANVAAAQALLANSQISCPGVKLHGSGFIVSQEQAKELGLGTVAGAELHIRHYRNGRDLTQKSRDALVIDLLGLEPNDVRSRFPAVYQWVVDHVKPERDQNNRATYRDNWWLFGEPRRDFRPALKNLDRFIATVETCKHRFFVLLDGVILPDNTLVTIAVNSTYHLGVLSSRLHVAWSLVAGGRLGVGNDPRYTKTRCFETFPFPEATDEQRSKIANAAEQLDRHRKERQAEHPTVSMTKMYNVLEKLRRDEALTDAEKFIYDKGLIAVLKELHDDLDRSVFEAYGWSDLADELVGKPGATAPILVKSEEHMEAEEELLSRLAALNLKRHADEQRGTVHWVRPAFQNPTGDRGIDQALLDTTTIEKKTKLKKRPWPKTLPEQMKSLRHELAQQPAPVTAVELARRFARAHTTKVEELLNTLIALGHARVDDKSRFTSR